MSDKRSGIYKICANGCIYVGGSVDIKYRLDSHILVLKRNEHHSSHMQFIFNKHGIDVFSFDILEYVPDKSRLLEREQFWLDWLFTNHDHDTVLNACRVASSRLGTKQSPEGIEKTRRANIGRKQTEEHKEKVRKAVTGLKRSDASKARYSRARTGVTHTENSVEKIANAKRGIKHTEESKQRMVDAATKRSKETFSFIDPFGCVHQTNNISDFCRNNNLSRKSMSAVWNGSTKTHRGWVRNYSDLITNSGGREKLSVYLIHTSGVLVHVTSVSAFCKEHNTSIRAIYSIIKRGYVQHKGWRLYDS